METYWQLFSRFTTEQQALLQALAWLAAAPLPSQLLTQCPFAADHDSPKWDNFCEALKKHHLITWQAERETFSIDSLFQRVPLAGITAAIDDQAPRSLLDAMNWLIVATPSRPQNTENLKMWEIFSPHILAVIEHGRRYQRSLSMARLLHLHALFFKAVGKLSDAESMFQEALDIQLQHLDGTHPNIADSLSHLASLATQRGQNDVAKEYYHKVLSIQQTRGDLHAQASAWHNLGTLALAESDFSTAREHFQKSLDLEIAAGKPQGDAATWHNLGTIDLNEGNHLSAREHFLKSLAIEQTNGNRAGEAATWHNLAYIDLNLCDYSSAREHFQKSYHIAHEIGHNSGVASALHGLATIDYDVGNYASARQHLHTVLEIESKTSDLAGQSAAWHQLANIDMSEGLYADARESFLKSLKIEETIGDPAGQSAAWHGLASIDLAEGNYSAAREKLQSVLAIRQNIGDRAGEAATWHQLAALSFAESGISLALIRLGAIAWRLLESIGQAEQLTALDNMEGMAKQLGLSHDQIASEIQNAFASYQKDRGVALLAAAFPD